MSIIISALRNPVISIQGFREFRSSFGMSWDDDSSKSDAYDSGRELAHVLTFRRYEV